MGGKIKNCSFLNDLQILGICYTALFGSWYYVFTHSIWGGFVYLYVFVIAIGCGTYCITELIYLFTSGNRKGFCNNF